MADHARHDHESALIAKISRAKGALEAILDCVGDLIIQVDHEGRIGRCNKAFAAFVELPFSEILGRQWQELIAARQLQSGQQCGHGCREYVHAPSGRILCGRQYPLQGEGREAEDRVITLQEITQQVALSHQLHAKNQKLTAAYEELKASQAKLLQQEKLASIGQLAAGVAHEINNPVGFVTSNLGSLGKYLNRLREFLGHQERLLAQSGDRSGQEEATALRKQLKIDFVLEDTVALLKESLDGVERVKVIVQNLKNFSRVDQALSSLTDINQCLEETLNIVWNELKYKAEVIKHYGELPPTWCRPQQLNQVFMNLLVNAAQAIADHGKITIRTWHRQGSIFVAITDTGCGIAMENLGRVFDPFFTTKEVGQGTGLGLSIVYDIVKQHGGEITAASAPGVGTTFRVRLPVRSKAEEDKGNGGSGQDSVR